MEMVCHLLNGALEDSGLANRREPRIDVDGD